MDAKYKVWAVTESSCATGISPFLGGFNSFKKARKCVSEMTGIYSFIRILDKEGRSWCFFKNRKI